MIIAAALLVLMVGVTGLVVWIERDNRSVDRNRDALERSAIDHQGWLGRS